MRLNVRFLAVLMGAACILTVCVASLHRSHAGRSTTLLLKKARSARDDGDLLEAVRLYKRVLRDTKDQPQPRLELADCLIKCGNLTEAFFQLEAEVRNRAVSDQARERFVAVAMQTGRLSDAKIQLEKYLIPKSPRNVGYLTQLAEVEQNLGEIERSKTLLQSAASIDPKDSQVVERLAYLLGDRLAQSQLAKEYLDGLVEQANDQASSYLARAKWTLGRARKTGEPELMQQYLISTEQDLRRAANLEPENLMASLLAAELATTTGKSTFASELITVGMSESPEDPRLYGAAAQLRLIDGDVPGATELLREGLRSFPGQPDLIWNLAGLEVESGEVESTKELIADLRAIEFGEAPIHFLEARVLLLDQEYQRAIASAKKSRSLSDRTDRDLLKRSDLLLAVCFERLGRTDLEIAALRRAVNADPLCRDARQTLASALTRTGSLQEAVAELRYLTLLNPNSTRALIDLAKCTLLHWQRSGALGYREEGEQLVKRLESLPGIEAEVSLLKAELLYASGDSEGAIQILETQIQTNPDSLEIYHGIVELHLRTKNFAAADMMLEQAKEEIGSIPALRLERANYLLRRYRSELPVERLDELSIPDPSWSREQQVELAKGFAALFRSIEDYERCGQQVALLNEWSEGKGELRLQLLLFDLALRKKDTRKLEFALQRIRKIEGEGPLWLVGKATLLAMQANGDTPGLLAEALKHLSTAATTRPTWHRISRLSAEINDSAGRRDVAIRHYLDAIRLGDRDPQIISRCVELLSQARRFVEADQVIRHLAEEYIPLSRNLTQIVSQLSIQLQDFDRALDLADRRAKQSGNLEDQFWLAQILRITGNYTEAERQFRTAIEIMPTRPEAWIALVQMHCSQGDLNSAEKVISEAEHSLSPEYAADTLAQCYQSADDEESAEKHYRQAIKESPGDSGVLRRFADFCLGSGRKTIATSLLGLLVSKDFEENLDDQMWGRRNLALSIGLQGNRENTERALSLIELNLELSDSSTEDLRCLAILLAKDPRPEKAAEGLKILLDVVSEQTNFSLPDNALLADLYRRRNDWANYCRTMRRVLGNGGAEIDGYVSQYATALIDRGELDEGQLWLSRLIELAPESKSTIKAEAKMLFAVGKYTALAVKLEQAAGSPDLVGEVAAICEYYGMQLRRGGQNQLSERLLKVAIKANIELARSDQEGALRLASYHARTGNLEKALELIPREGANPFQLVALAYGAIQSGSENRDGVSELIGQLQLADETGQPEVLICLGDLCSWLGESEKACDAYYRVLENDPSNLTARNNLAAICALTSTQLTRAMSAIESVIGDAGPTAAFLDTRGLVHMASSRFDAAEADFRKAIELAGKATYHFHLAQTLVSQERFTDAVKSLRLAEKTLKVDTLLPLERSALQQLNKTLQTIATSN